MGKTIDDSGVEDFVCKLKEKVEKSVVMKSSKKCLREEVVITAAHDISDIVKPNLGRKTKIMKSVKTLKQEKSKQLGSTMVKLKKSIKIDMGKMKKEVLKKEILSSKKVKSIK